MRYGFLSPFLQPQILFTTNEPQSYVFGGRNHPLHINSQKAMLEDYAEKNGFTGIRHFTDDGISGTTFEREGLNAMLAEVEKGNIGTIIVKDMSRLGRNYVQMGMLREQLRMANVRLIAVNEGVDTGSGFDDDFLPFRDVINEYYAKDISKKIKSTFKAKGESGKHIASSPPYGYLKDSGDKNQWVIDEVAAPVATCQGRIHFSSLFLDFPCLPCSKSWRITRFSLSSTFWVLVSEKYTSTK